MEEEDVRGILISMFGIWWALSL